MRVLLIWIVALVVAGCASTSAEVSPAPSSTPLAAAALPTSTLLPAPTATPRPTDTPVPTATPSPPATATPVPAATATATPAATPLPPVTLGQQVALVPAARDLLSGQADLPGYEIEAVVDMEALSVSGHQRLVYTHRQDAPLSELHLNLYPNAPCFGGEMTVNNVLVGGRPARTSYERDRRVLRIVLPAPLSAGEVTLVELDFALQVPQLEENRFQVLLYSKGILSLAGWYPSLAVLDGTGWHLDYPCRAEIGEVMLADSAFYTVQIRVPQTLVVAATGVQVAETTQEDGTRTLTYRSGPSRTFYLSASPEYQVIDGQAGEIAVHSYYLPGHGECAQWALEAAVAALDLYQGRYGLYPFAEFDVVEGDRWYEAMEWPGVMVQASVFYDGSDPACGEWFVAHEVAHQWWYNVVGSDPVAHPWLDEAFAQYSAMLYFRRLWPASAAQAYIQPIIYDRYAAYASQAAEVHLDQPTTAFDDREAYYAVVYARGAMFLEALNQALGEQAFFAALQQYYQQNQFQIATPDQLKASLRASDAAAVDALWAEWVDAP